MHKQVKVWFLVTYLVLEVLFSVWFVTTSNPHLLTFLFIGLLLFVVLGLFFATFIYYPLVLKSMSTNIKAEVGKYTTITNLSGFDSVFDSSGEKLIITEDNKLYRVKIEQTKLTDITQVESRVLTN